ncbi:MAG: asparagine synthase (glutamine-hydrolyzing) [Alphaproteobacteria bacterium]|nr:asparagine synthase (glutamine-hydrolyzing) [Alphaproteobacteria bacterium]
MCGIAGLFATTNVRSRADLHAIARNMNDTLAHRGPDGGDLWQDPDLPLVLAQRRLAIIDLSPEGAQPMASSSGRYHVTYNGEIYNFLELRKELEAQGATFRGRSDTEVFLESLEAWGLAQTLQKINGMYALVLWDRKTRQIHFVRDRLGKKPLYIGWAGSTLVFGSELKALRRHPDFQNRISPAGLGLYMNQGCLPAPFTIHDNIWMLPPGHILSLESQALSPGADLATLSLPYWDKIAVLRQARLNPPARDEKTVIDEFEALLEDCVRQRMISDVPLGAFLSGGIDSSTVVALMQKHSMRPVKTYSIGFQESGFDEAVFARPIAAHLGTDHQEQFLDSRTAREIVPDLPQMFDEPFADCSAIPTYLVAKFARQDVTVALSGDGGDEMLGGYKRHQIGPKLWRAMRMIPMPARTLAGAIAGAVPYHVWNRLNPARPEFGRAMHKLADVLKAQSPAQLYQSLISHYEHPPLTQAVRAVTPLSRTYEEDFSNLSLNERMMLWDTVSYLPDDIMTKVDRASMAVSLEARAPLLDYRVFEFAWRLPLSYKIRGSKGKWLLRQVLARHVSPSLFDRPKQGFTPPIAQWLRGDLKAWAQDLLSDATHSSQDLLDMRAVNALWQAHSNHSADHATKLWTVLMFLAWRRHWG